MPFACSIRRNSFPTRYLPFLSLRRNWLCLIRLGPTGAGLSDLAGPRPFLPACVRLALFSEIAPSVGSASGPAGQRLFRPVQGKLGLFGTTGPSDGSASGPAGQRLFRPVQGKLGLFGTTGPSDGSAGAFAGPPPSPSVSANWLCLYNRSQRRLRGRSRPFPPAPVDAADWLCLVRTRSEYRVYADRTGLSRLKAVLRTVQDHLCDLRASGVDLRRGRVPGRSRRNPPKLWSLICNPLFCCPIIIQVHQFLVK